MNSELTKAQRVARDEQIWNRYLQGVPQSDIAAEHGIVQSLVSAIIRKRRQALSLESDALMKTLTARHTRAYQVAEANNNAGDMVKASEAIAKLHGLDKPPAAPPLGPVKVERNP